MKQLVTKGIVLKRTNFGEADRIVTFITPEYGKVRLIAKGVRKNTSKLAGGIELLSVSNITFIQGKKDIGTLISSRLQTYFGEIVKDINRTMLAYELLKMLDKTTQDECEAAFYELLEDTLTGVNNKDIHPKLMEAWFYMQLLSLLGHAPNLETDNEGAKLISKQTYEFDFDAMAFFARSDGLYTDKHIKLLRLMSAHAAQQVAQVGQVTDLYESCVLLLRTLIKTNGHV